MLSDPDRWTLPGDGVTLPLVTVKMFSHQETTDSDTHTEIGQWEQERSITSITYARLNFFSKPAAHSDQNGHVKLLKYKIVKYDFKKTRRSL